MVTWKSSINLIGSIDFIQGDTFLTEPLFLAVGDLAIRAQGTLGVPAVERVPAVDLAEGYAIKAALRT